MVRRLEDVCLNPLLLCSNAVVQKEELACRQTAAANLNARRDSSSSWSGLRLLTASLAKSDAASLDPVLAHKTVGVHFGKERKCI